jgi:YspA, cpYpsA-related SLOG family
LIRRVLVCGGRDYNDRDHVWNTLTALDHMLGPFSVIIHGAARGADSLAKEWALATGRKEESYKADWGRLGPAAGPIRNQKMINEGRPDLVIGFSGGRGTADMCRRARAAGIKVIEIEAREA